MKIAIIGGTGDQGLGLALRFVKAGEDIIIGSRDAKKAESAVNTVKEMLEGEVSNICGSTNVDAAKEGDIILLTVPLQAQIITLKSIKEFIGDKIVIDATVPLDGCLGGRPTRYVDVWQGSAAERTAELLENTDARVVSAFNNISAPSLLNVKRDVDCDCLVSGDDEEARKTVMTLAEKIPKIRSVDCGPLENARMVEKLTPLLINLNIRNKIKFAGLRITGL
ncbi:MULTISPECIES: NADPH-dependent F420 reductase [Methanobacterium]|uniref:F420-dependent NADP reductase n=1 Tax=Methanobacterium bryantii TaxID=2161 RepID=A0A2A2H2A9_METBR|nr:MULTISPECIES: NADPH-dependent F420 reductase [Methanobacterium]OEC88125.1 NADPH-dependent F420 reductase [Methanobacterium sp. A39]PAV03529.1 F420-dependent NADP reductase [Methanobacterium bryantii]